MYTNMCIIYNATKLGIYTVYINMYIYKYVILRA